MARLTPDPTLYPTVRDAIKSPPEDVAYVAALYVGTGVEEPDFLAVVDVDPSSEHTARSCTSSRCRI
jgi:selenium-binding protein 1